MNRFISTISKIIFAVWGIFFAHGASAQDTLEYPELFIYNNSVVVLYHEIGHLLIGELQIPVLAKEEDAADNLAAVMLLSTETDAADAMLIDAATGWFLSDELNTEEFIEEAALYDSHSLDLQRAYQMICLMVGADADVFGPTADEAGIDADRQDECQFEFGQTMLSWGKVLEDHASADGAEPADISVVYEPTDNYGDVKAMLESTRFLEDAAEQIISGYTLPRPITLRAAECETANAFYDPETGEVQFCYEMAEHFQKLYDLWTSEEG